MGISSRFFANMLSEGANRDGTEPLPENSMSATTSDSPGDCADRYNRRGNSKTHRGVNRVV